MGSKVELISSISGKLDAPPRRRGRKSRTRPDRTAPVLPVFPGWTVRARAAGLEPLPRAAPPQPTGPARAGGFRRGRALHQALRRLVAGRCARRARFGKVARGPRVFGLGCGRLRCGARLRVSRPRQGLAARGAFAAQAALARTVETPAFPVRPAGTKPCHRQSIEPLFPLPGSKIGVNLVLCGTIRTNQTHTHSQICAYLPLARVRYML